MMAVSLVGVSQVDPSLAALMDPPVVPPLSWCGLGVVNQKRSGEALLGSFVGKIYK
jgi:hypothetical protein